MIATMTVEDMFHKHCRANGITNYSFKYDNRTTRLMACQFQYVHRDLYGTYSPSRSHFIFHISKKFLTILSEREVETTVLHEIAHALVDPRKPDHGPEWRRTCLAIGGDGNRLHKTAPEQKKVLAKYEGHCPGGHVFYRQRLSQRARMTTVCTICNPYYDIANKITWKELR